MWTSSSALLRLTFSLLLLGTLSLTTLGLGGCKQDEGDRCQLDSDCSDGLICCFSVNPPPLEQRYLGGTCTSVNQCSTTQPDLGEIDDGGTPDADTPDADTPETGTDTTPAGDSTVDTTPAADSTVDTTPAADSTVDTTSADSSSDSTVDGQ